MKTTGGYSITEFKQLEANIDKFPLKPNIYSGIVDDPISKKKIVVYWNELGQCNNPERTDCYIKIG